MHMKLLPHSLVGKTPDSDSEVFGSNPNEAAKFHARLTQG